MFSCFYNKKDFKGLDVILFYNSTESSSDEMIKILIREETIRDIKIFYDISRPGDLEEAKKCEKDIVNRKLPLFVSRFLGTKTSGLKKSSRKVVRSLYLSKFTNFYEL
jgi:hypothetical protein